MAVRFVCAWILLAGWPVAAGAQSSPVSDVDGQVVSVDGNPVPGADVVLRAADGRQFETVSGEDGRFGFDNVRAGAYGLLAVSLGRSPSNQTVVVSEGRPLEVTVVLPDIVQERVNVVGHPSALDRIPGSAHVIAPAEMQTVLVSTNDIHQMLRQIPGLNLQEEEGFGLRPNIGMRGSGTDRSAKITLMEDGILVAPAPYAAPAAYYSPTAGRIEALEVRKGSSQIRYGPNTTGGVLNYVSTSIPSDFRLRANFAAGGDNMRKVTANLGDVYRNFGWLVETFQLRNDGFKTLDGGGKTGVDVADYLVKLRFNTTPTQSFYQEVEVKLGRTEQTGDETYLGLTDADFARTPFRRYAASQVDVFDSEHEQYQVRHLLAARAWDLTTIAYRNDFYRSWYKLQSVLGSGPASVLANPEAFPGQMSVLTGADSAPNALVVRDNNRTYYGAGLQSVLGFSAGAGALRHAFEIGLRYHRDEEDRFQHEDAYQMIAGRMVLTRPGAPGSQSNRVSGADAVAVFASDTVTWGAWSLSPGLRYETISLERVDYRSTDPARTSPARARRSSLRVVVPGIGVSYAIRPGISLFGGVHKGFAPPGPGSDDATKAEESVN